jgi:exopolysaccharide biosynthesis polyprenyl glycosylphosphotransferase
VHPLAPTADLAGAVVGAVVVLATRDVPINLLGAIACLWVVLLRAAEPSPSLLHPLADGARAVVRATCVAAFACWGAAALLGSQTTPGVALTFSAVAGATTLLVRFAGAAWRRTGPVQTLVVGEADDATETAEELAELSDGRLVPVAGCSPEELAATLESSWPDAVLVLPSREFSGRAVQRTAWDLEALGIPMLVQTGLSDVSRRRCGANRVGRLNLLQVTVAPRRGGRLALKEAWERSAALLALVLLLPAIAAVAVAIRVDSRGPVFFRQTRVGLRGQHFTMWKFRTMRTDAERMREAVESHFDQVLFKNRQDPRVTRVGRVLRKYSVDELPQLINVVAGHMALVGPRPALPDEVAAYDDDMRRRLAVKPGITGLWQVSGRSDLPWRETVRLDLDYVDNWSFSRDLTIVARTVRAVLDHRGAY